MRSFVPAIFLAAFTTAYAGVIIAPAVAPLAYGTVPLVTRTVYAAPGGSVKSDESFINGRAGTIHTKKVASNAGPFNPSLKTDESFINGQAGTIHTKKVSSQPGGYYAAPADKVETDDVLYNGQTGSIHTKKVSAESGVVHAPVIAYHAPVVAAHQFIPPAVVHQW